MDEGQVGYGHVSRLSDLVWLIQNSPDFFRTKSVVTEYGLKCIQVSFETVLLQIAVFHCAKMDSTEISYIEWGSDLAFWFELVWVDFSVYIVIQEAVLSG